MMQSTPLNLRRAVMWLGRLILGPVFIYAGYSKAFLPNSHFWPWFFFKFSLSTNIANFAFQVEAFKLLPPWGVQFVAHTLPFTEIVLGFLVLIGWQLRIFGSMLAAIMVGFSVVVTRAYLLHMNINCGCFATPQPINTEKVLEDAAMAILGVLMAAFAIMESRKPHPWSASAEDVVAPVTK
ncbi:MAG TPA: MauE/DoxX family redox-associated membrane protein [Candidatus Sulfotelmatobacter sp.]|nr:MauE/DoxX family redox-associated membrane protein [Candidatus Sulfotelmatobacter sp.]